MKFKTTLLAVTDMERSLSFYRTVLGLRVVEDFGASKTLAGGLVLQTAGTWAALIGTVPEGLGWFGRVNELCFEEENLDAFAARLESLDIHYVHPVKEHTRGRRTVRLYDPDGHIIEVSETLKAACVRLRAGGMMPEQIAERMGVPMKRVNAMLR